MEKKVKLCSLFPRMVFSKPCEQRMRQNHVYRLPSHLDPTRTLVIRVLLFSLSDETSKFQKSPHLFKCSSYKSSKLLPFWNQQVTDPQQVCGLYPP